MNNNITAKIYTPPATDQTEAIRHKTSSRLIITDQKGNELAREVKFMTNQRLASIHNFLSLAWAFFMNIFPNTEKFPRVKWVLMNIEDPENSNKTKAVCVNVNSLMKHMHFAEKEREDFLIRCSDPSEQEGPILDTILTSPSMEIEWEEDPNAEAEPIESDDEAEDAIDAKEFDPGNYLVSVLAVAKQRDQERLKAIRDAIDAKSSRLFSRKIKLKRNDEFDYAQAVRDISTANANKWISYQSYRYTISRELGQAAGKQTPSAQESLENWSLAERTIYKWAENNKPLTLELMQTLNRLVCGKSDDKAGQFRELGENVSVEDGEFVPGTYVKEELARFQTWLDEQLKACDEKEANPVEVAAKAHQYLLSIHPFSSGNGRTARLMMDLILMKYHLPPCTFKHSMQRHLALLWGSEDDTNVDMLLNFVHEGILKTCELLGLPSPFSPASR